MQKKKKRRRSCLKKGTKKIDNHVSWEQPARSPLPPAPGAALEWRIKAPVPLPFPDKIPSQIHSFQSHPYQDPFLRSILVGPQFFFFNLFKAIPVAYGGSQARGGMGATAASLRHSHSHARSELHLRPTPQLMATPDP